MRGHSVALLTYPSINAVGIRIIGVSDGTDTSRQGYKLETGIRGLISEIYLDDLADKTHRGLTGLVLDGYSAGGQPYGYTSIPDERGHRIIINEEQQPYVQYIFQRYASGVSPRQIASELNAQGIPSPRGGHLGSFGNISVK